MTNMYEKIMVAIDGSEKAEKRICRSVRIS